ncbi:MAG: nuclear transport factor 2 family protein [Acidimicrobiia bacterium]
MEWLVACEEIRRLKARYFRAVDTKSWDLLAEVFAPDAVSGPNERGDVTVGIEAITERLRNALGEVQTVHQGHSPEVELTSPTTADAVWAQEDHLWGFPAGSTGRVHGYGHYYDTYVKLDGGWRIASTRLVRIRVDVTPPEPDDA